MVIPMQPRQTPHVEALFLDFPGWSDHTTIFMQLAQWLRLMITAGELRDGDRLPSARDLATQLAINPMTVSEALRTLKDDSLVYAKRGQGMYVADGANEKCKAEEMALMSERDIPQLIARLSRIGYRNDPAVKALQNLKSKLSSLPV